MSKTSPRTAPDLTIRRGVVVLALLAGVPAASNAQSALEETNPCGPLSQGHYGPFDYRTASRGQKDIVENAHFRRDTYLNLKGTTGPAGGDINYTLRSFPNHHRALDAMQRLAAFEKADPPRGAMYTVECYYERALRFVPNDQVVRLLYVNFLIKRGRKEEAGKHLEYIVSTTPDQALTQYNAGLLYADMGAWDQALVQAHRALAMGLLKPELKHRLEKENRWIEPVAEAASAASQ
jgi:tetratricopeptide (TPR) repeat protein